MPRRPPGSLHRSGARRARPLAAALCLAATAACSSGGPKFDQARNPAAAFPAGTSGARVEIPITPEILEIQRLADRRSLGRGRLIELLDHADDKVRVAAAEALGRMPYPDFGAAVTEPLCRALEDPVVEVRQAAAFALGIRGDRSSAPVLGAYRNDHDPRMRVLVVQAMGRLATPELEEGLLVALRDSDGAVRKEAAESTALWSTDHPGAEEVDRALLDALRPYIIAPSAEKPSAHDTDFEWRVLYALERRRSELGRAAFLEYVDSANVLARLFAVRGLASLPPDEESAAALARILTEGRGTSDWRVTYEAVVGLGRTSSGLDALLGAIEHENPHVRAAVFEALGSFPEARNRVLPKLRRGALDLSATARAASLESTVRLVSPDEGIEHLQRFVGNEDSVVRAGVARAAGRIDDARAFALLQQLARDKDPFVGTAAVEALGAHPRQETRALLHTLLESPDNGIRLAAVLALEKNPAPEDVAPLGKAFATSQGDISGEIAFNVLEALGAIGGEGVQRFLERAASDTRPHVRRVARRVLRSRFGVDLPPEPRAPFADDGPIPVPGVDYPRWQNNPMAEVRTSRGTMVFELFPAEAPIHVYNFLTLAEAGHYDDLLFHRVVPDFVIQGGDYRGDGNGGAPWRGDALRNEFGRRKFLRGSLGMPRNEDPDSGGSQFFVTQRPTPHLDGRYTLFGQLRTGGEALDRVEVGDRILSVRLIRR